MPDYKVNVIDPSGALDPSISWKRYRADLPLEYGNEIIVEAEQGDATDAPSSVRARVVSVDNDAFFTSTVTVQPIDEN